LEEFQQKLLDDPDKLIDDVMSGLSKEEKNAITLNIESTMANMETTLNTNLLEKEVEKLNIIQEEFVEKQQILSDYENEN